MKYKKRLENLETTFNTTDSRIILALVAKAIRKAYEQGWKESRTLKKREDSRSSNDFIHYPETNAIIYSKQQGWEI